MRKSPVLEKISNRIGNAVISPLGCRLAVAFTSKTGRLLVFRRKGKAIYCRLPNDHPVCALELICDLHAAANPVDRRCFDRSAHGYSTGRDSHWHWERQRTVWLVGVHWVDTSGGGPKASFVRPTRTLLCPRWVF